MRYNNETRKTQSLNNKAKILASAKKLIEQKGFENVTVLDITSNANVSKGSFYIHFKSKEEVIEALFNAKFDRFIENDLTKSTYERVYSFIIKSCQHIMNQGVKMVQKWFSEAVSGSISGQQKQNYDLKTLEKILSKDLEGDAVKSLAQEILSLYYGSLCLWCVSNGTFDCLKTIKKYLKEKLN